MAERSSEITEDSCQSADSDFEQTPPVRQTSIKTTESYEFCESGCFSSTVVSSPRMVHNPFAAKVNTPTRSMADSTDSKESRRILAPPTLVLDKYSEDRENHSNRVFSVFRLRPPVLNNPFLRTESTNKNPEARNTTEVLLAEQKPTCDQNSDHVQLRCFGDSSVLNQQPCTTSQPTVLQPLCRSPVATSSLDGSLSLSHSASDACSGRNADAPVGSDFVFGQNMNERVTNVKMDSSMSNGTADLSFSTELLSSHPSDFDVKNDASTNGHSGRQAKSLTESALEYESRKVKRTYEEVAVVTGEEDESNVLQVHCKLFTFDKVTSTWIERGRGLLRLNDKEVEEGVIQSRIIARTQGSLRVVLNTKVWSGMSVDRPSPNSVRLTAMDGDTIKVFLIKARPKDCDQLFGALDWRVTTRKSLEERRLNEPLVSFSAACHSSKELPFVSTSGEESDSLVASPPCLSCSPDLALSVDEDASQMAASGECSKKRRISPPSAASNSDTSDTEERRLDDIETELVSDNGSASSCSTTTAT